MAGALSGALGGSRGSQCGHVGGGGAAQKKGWAPRKGLLGSCLAKALEGSQTRVLTSLRFWKLPQQRFLMFLRRQIKSLFGTCSRAPQIHVLSP